MLDKAKSLYGSFARGAAWLQPLSLLAVRFVWGYQFFVAGRGKLENLDTAAERFAGFGLPAPYASAVLASVTECVAGLLLVFGLGARPAALALSGTMVVALSTAHRKEFTQLFSNTSEFLDAAPIPFLVGSLVVLAFGAGKLSVDAIIARTLCKSCERAPAHAPNKRNAETLP